jgi:hypothetical protein
MSRRSNLEIALSQQTHFRIQPHCHRLGPAWVRISSELFRRHIAERERLDEVCGDLQLNQDAAEYLLMLMRDCRKTTAGHRYRAATETEAIPPWVRRDSARSASDDIGRAILLAAESDISLVARTISIYAAAVNTDRQIVFDPALESQVSFARTLIEFVTSLHIHSLGFRVVGFRDSTGQHADLSTVSTKFRPREAMPTRVLMSRNILANSSGRLVGLEVTRTISSDLD